MKNKIERMRRNQFHEQHRGVCEGTYELERAGIPHGSVRNNTEPKVKPAKPMGQRNEALPRARVDRLQCFTGAEPRDFGNVISEK